MGTDEAPVTVQDRVVAELVDCTPPPAAATPVPAAPESSPTEKAADATIESTGADPPPGAPRAWFLRWRVYYDDGTTADSATTAIPDVPVDGVIVIAQAHDDPADPTRGGRELLSDRDFYYWEHTRWYKADAYGRDDYLRRPGWKRVLAGRNTTSANYHALLVRALTDPDLPPKSAGLASEARS